MYLSFYRFSEKPFNLTPDPDFFYLTPIHKRALAYLIYGLENKKGFITVSGEVGAGKTTLIHTMLRKVDGNTIISRVNNTQVDEVQLLRMILRDFGVSKKFQLKEDILDALNDFLLRQYARGKNVLLIIDEAQNLSIKALEEIRLISNLETEKEKLIQIILVGQPELRDTLGLPELRQLKQRITVSYHLGHLGHEDVGNYIEHRLSVAGYHGDDIFSKDAVSEIFNVSGGTPRLINLICDAALLSGYVENKKFLDRELILQVISDLDLDIQMESKRSSKLPTSFANNDDVKPSSISELEAKFEDISQKVEMLYKKSLKESTWEVELLSREREVREFERELFSKMEHIMEFERELNKREELISRRESNFISSSCEADQKPPLSGSDPFSNTKK